LPDERGAFPYQDVLAKKLKGGIAGEHSWHIVVIEGNQRRVPSVSEDKNFSVDFEQSPGT
jgi:hypothetical protein